MNRLLFTLIASIVMTTSAYAQTVQTVPANTPLTLQWEPSLIDADHPEAATSYGVWIDNAVFRPLGLPAPIEGKLSAPLDGLAAGPHSLVLYAFNDTSPSDPAPVVRVLAAMVSPNSPPPNPPRNATVVITITLEAK